MNLHKEYVREKNKKKERKEDSFANSLNYKN